MRTRAEGLVAFWWAEMSAWLDAFPVNLLVQGFDARGLKLDCPACGKSASTLGELASISAERERARPAV